MQEEEEEEEEEGKVRRGEAPVRDTISSTQRTMPNILINIYEGTMARGPLASSFFNSETRDETRRAAAAVS